MYIQYVAKSVREIYGSLNGRKRQKAVQRATFWKAKLKK